MISRRSRSCAAVLAALLTVQPYVVAQGQGPAKGPGGPGPFTFETLSGQRIKVTLVADGLVHPYGMAFPDARTMLVTERAGRLRVIKDGKLLVKPAWEMPAPPAGSPPSNNPPDLLHFVELHPAFAQNQLVYLSYPKYGPRGNTIAVGRGTLRGDTLTGFTEIFVSEAWESYGANPGRMLFMRDGTLLVTVGDRDRYCCDGSENSSQRMKAQTLDNDFGKILRIRDDGSIPPDNPFVGRPGALPQIYSYGHRNAYGLAYNPETGELWESEIGPLGGDEINILHAGHNYGWPLVSTGRNYTGTPVSDRPWTREGMDDPRMVWTPVISPSGLIFYTGDRFPGWKGSAFLGALNGKALWRVSLNNPKPQQVEQREVLLAALDVRIRDVQQGPDGNLYIATELQSTGVKPEGTVMRIEPVPAAAQRAATGRWTPPRTPWGDPDLQGIYTNKDENNTPFERPDEFAGKRLSDFGETEMLALRKQRQEAAARQAPGIGGTADEDTGAGPPHWYEHFDAANAQPWLVIEPEDGRVPPLTAAARARAAARQAARKGRGPSDSYTDRSLYDRCISRGVPDVMRPIIYGASYDITQSPGYVVIRYEMIHDTRVIPLDRRPALSPKIRQYMGDSRGWWQGDTLVVETTNIHGAMLYRGASSGLKVTERFTPVGPNVISWTARMEDPTTWERPWAIRMPLKRDDTQAIFEFGCHEGNRALENILRAARASEAR